MLPSGFTASFAFMLPVATPGNGMIFATGKITIMQMVSEVTPRARIPHCA